MRRKGQVAMVHWDTEGLYASVERRGGGDMPRLYPEASACLQVKVTVPGEESRP